MTRGLSFPEFSRLVRKFPLVPGERLGVAVSGGPDSMALLFLLSKYLPKKVHAITVDHKIRPGSTNEANNVKAFIKSHGIPCAMYTIDWGCEPPATLSTSKLEDAARIHRYRLLSKACKDLNIQKLFFGHHLNDLSETILYRLGRASGIGGFAPMLPQSHFPFVQTPSDAAIRVFRPLLSVPKQKLIETCEEMNIKYVQDPMNRDLHFYRSRLRSLFSDPPHTMFSEENVRTFTQQLSEFGKETLNMERKLILECVITDPQSGTLFLSLPSLLQNKDHWMHQPHIAHRVLSVLLRWVMCASYPPSLATLETLRRFMCTYSPGNRKGAHVHSIFRALVFPPRPVYNGPTNWIFVRSPPLGHEWKNHILPLPKLSETILFDNRFFVTRVLPPVDLKSNDLKQFYKNMETYLPSKLCLDKTHELVVRHFSTRDEIDLARVLFKHQLHSAWIEYTRAYEHFKFKMPRQGRNSILVIALREKCESWANQPLLAKQGRLVAIPALGIHFMPAHFGFHVEYCQPLKRLLGIEQDSNEQTTRIL